MARRREYFIETKTKDLYLFDEWITKLEMRSFGWHYKGLDTFYYDGYYDVSYNEYDNTVSVKNKREVYLTFKRIKPYSKKLFFKFLEMLMSIQSWIRRKLILWLWVLTALLLGLGVIELVSTGNFSQNLGFGIIIPIMVYTPSLFYCLLGWLYRKICRVDERLKDDLEKYGYKRDQKV